MERTEILRELKAMEDRLIERLKIEILAASFGDDRLITPKEVAGILGVSEYAVAELRRSKALPSGFLGKDRKPRFSAGTVRRYMRKIMSAA